MRRFTRLEFADAIHLREVDEPARFVSDRWGLANLIRDFIFCHGVTTRRELLAYLVPIFEALDEAGEIDRKQLIELADDLSALGDIKMVRVGREHGWTKALGQWVRVSENYGVILGAIPSDSLVDVVTMPSSRNEIARRFSLFNPATQKIVDREEEISLDAWRGENGWVAYLRSRSGSCDESATLREFWSQLVIELGESSTVAADDDSIRVLAGTPGDFFGKYSSRLPEGRWRKLDSIKEGIYVGSRSAWRENDRRFMLIEIREDRRHRVLTLENRDEFLWAVLAKGITLSQPEFLIVEGCKVTLHFMPPCQLSGLLNLMGRNTGGWTWEFSSPCDRSLIEYWSH